MTKILKRINNKELKINEETQGNPHDNVKLSNVNNSLLVLNYIALPNIFTIPVYVIWFTVSHKL